MCTSTLNRITRAKTLSRTRASPTVYVSPAQKTSPDCPAGPPVPRLDVITAMLLPLLCEAVSQPACPSLLTIYRKGRRGKGRRDRSSPISDHKSSSSASFVLALPPSDRGGSDHLSTLRKLNLRRVPPDVDPATRSAAMRPWYPPRQCETTEAKKRKDRRLKDQPTAAETAFHRYLAS